MSKIVTHGFASIHARTVHCGECTPPPRLTHFLRRASESDMPAVVQLVDEKAFQWDGPVGRCRQVYRQGDCPRCGTTHVVPVSITADFYSPYEQATRDADQSQGPIGMGDPATTHDSTLAAPPRPSPPSGASPSSSPEPF